MEYGNDLDTKEFGTGFGRGPVSLLCRVGHEARHPWDLSVLPRLPGSLLRHLRGDITGVTKPWLYFGMLFSAFCWHCEDHYLPSLNYLHTGAPQTWYGIPSRKAKPFERLMKVVVPTLFREEPGLLHGLVTMISPGTCLENDVPITTVLQEPGTFIVTFPNAYHAGFSHGFNCGEAVNFAPASWLPFGRLSVDNYRFNASRRPPIFSHDQLIWDASTSALGDARSRSGGGHVGPSGDARPTGSLGGPGPGPAPTSLACPANARFLFDEMLTAVRDELYLRAHVCGGLEAPGRLGRGLRISFVAVADGRAETSASDKCCATCGVMPFFSMLRCSCKEKNVTCLLPGCAVASCDCAGDAQTLEVHVRDGQLRARVSALAAAFALENKLPVVGADFVAPEIAAAAAADVWQDAKLWRLRMQAEKEGKGPPVASASAPPARCPQPGLPPMIGLVMTHGAASLPQDVRAFKRAAETGSPLQAADGAQGGLKKGKADFPPTS